MFHLGHPELSGAHNPVGSFSRITEVATRIAGQLPPRAVGCVQGEFVWRFRNVMARALVALGRKPDYEQINRYASKRRAALIDYFEHWLDPGVSRRPDGGKMSNRWPSTRKASDRGCRRGFRAVTGRIRTARSSYDPIAHALASALNYEKSYFDKAGRVPLPPHGEVTDGTRTWHSPDRTIQWTGVRCSIERPVINPGGSSISDWIPVRLRVALRRWAIPDVHDLTSVAGSLYKFGVGRGLPGETAPRRIAIHADEFNELIGDEFIPC